jgi:rifampicin phosphotransferase
MLVLPSSTPAFARREAGGKGWNLYQLSALGLPVPPFCVLGRRFFEQFLDRTELRARIAGWLGELGAGRLTPEAVEACERPSNRRPSVASSKAGWRARSTTPAR